MTRSQTDAAQGPASSVARGLKPPPQRRVQATPAWHIVTGEYPPGIGGVGDYTRLVARQLVSFGATVHVWCPGSEGDALDEGVMVHRVAGSWRSADLRRVEAAVSAAGPGTLLVQWVPHAFGRRSLNVGFCRWARRQAQNGRALEVMIHEPSLSFGEGSWRQDAAAAIHRVMLVVLLARARRIWVAIPAWERKLRPWLLGRTVPIDWLPVPSNIDVVPAPARVDAIRATLRGSCRLVVGHFGTFGRATRNPLREALRLIMVEDPDIAVALIGRDGDAFRQELVADCSAARDRITATGALDALELSCHLQACDVMLQPYIDGASSRRGTLMASLAHARPVVTTVGRLSEPLWRQQHGRAVLAVQADDARGLADSTLNLVRHPELRLRLGASGLALYQSSFALDHTVQALLAAEAAA